MGQGDLENLGNVSPPWPPGGLPLGAGWPSCEGYWPRWAGGRQEDDDDNNNKDDVWSTFGAYPLDCTEAQNIGSHFPQVVLQPVSRKDVSSAALDGGNRHRCGGANRLSTALFNQFLQPERGAFLRTRNQQSGVCFVPYYQCLVSFSKDSPVFWKRWLPITPRKIHLHNIKYIFSESPRWDLFHDVVFISFRDVELY